MFLEALKLVPTERPAFLDEMCGDDADRRSAVEALLAGDQRTLDLEAVPGLNVRDGLTQLDEQVRAVNALPQDAILPTRIGAYRIIRVLGTGGMGTVYEARQSNPQRKVALKVIRPDLISPRAIQRFQYEANALGQLQHPGIAHIYEAGLGTVESDGTSEPVAKPFLALEYIEGRPLTDYVSQHDLGIPQRLELIVKICDAVQHAHQKGVIHRDLKPGNILVDASGEPKILDFGVARFVDADVQTITRLTDAAQLVGTIPYMSPEQVAGDPDKLDTRSDVYAIGVILYELLGRRLPHDVRSRSLPEAVRIIQQDTPTRLSSIDPLLRGDLETITAKALEKECNRRYQSAGELAEDLRRYLRDEPIVARPPSATYQLRKFARRNRALVGGLVGTLAALVLGLVGTSWFALVATRERDIAKDARDEARRSYAQAEAINQFLIEDMIGSATQEREGYKVTIAEALEYARGRVAERFENQPELEAAVRHAIGDVYLSLGILDVATTELQKALTIRQRRLGPNAEETLQTAGALAITLEDQDRLDEALPLLSDTLERCETVLGPSHTLTLKMRQLLGDVLQSQGKHAQAEPLLRETLAAQRRLLGRDNEMTLATMTSLSGCLQAQNKLAETEVVLAELLEISRSSYPTSHPANLAALNNMASLLTSLKKHREAAPLYAELVALVEEALPSDHWQVAFAHYGYGVCLASLQDHEQAKPYLLTAYEGFSRSLGENHFYAEKAVTALYEACYALQQDEDGLRYHQRSVETRLRAASPNQHDSVVAVVREFEVQLANRGRADATVAANELLMQTADQMAADHPDHIRFLYNYGYALKELQRPALAEACLRASIADASSMSETSNPAAAQAKSVLAELLTESGAAADEESLALPAGDAKSNKMSIVRDE